MRKADTSMKRDELLAASRKDAAVAIEQWILTHQGAHIKAVLAHDNDDGSVEITILYEQENKSNGHA